jgi:hypothetical protein
MKKSIILFVLFPFFTTFSDFSVNQEISSQVSVGNAFLSNAQPKLARKRAHVKGYRLSDGQKKIKRAFNITIGSLIGIGAGLGLILFGIGLLLLKAGL